MGKKLVALVMTFVMLVSLIGAAQATQTDSMEPEVSVAAISAAETEIFDALSVYYNIGNIDSSIESLTIKEDAFSATVRTCVDMVLLAETPEELPAIQGMLSAIKVETSDNVLHQDPNNDINISQLSAANPERSIDEVAMAAEFVNDEIEAVQQYIGKEQFIQYYTKVSGVISNGTAVVTELLAEDGAGGYCAMDAVLPETPKKIFDNYENLVWPTAEAKLVRTENAASLLASSKNYDVLAARDYARKWVYGFGQKKGEPSSMNCSVCGKSSANCSGYSVHNYYNTADYSVYDHNDCANFASQALAAGGLPTDKTWKKDSTAWINARALEEYLLDKNYLVDDGYSTAAGGGLIFCKNSAGGNAYHVEVIVANDTVTRQFCAHTHDRYNTSTANMKNWKYYNINY